MNSEAKSEVEIQHVIKKLESSGFLLKEKVLDMSASLNDEQYFFSGGKAQLHK